MDIFKTLLIQNPPNLALEGQVSYQGTWDASANSPALTSSVGTKGYYYVVSTSGSTNLNGVTTWTVGDWAIFNGAVWQKVDNTDAITSINGTTNQIVASSSTGDVTLSLPTAITNVNSITAQSATNLTLNGGSSGASIVAGQGTNASITLTPSGTGGVNVAGVTGLGKFNVRTETNGNLHCRPYSLLNGSGVGVALDSLNDLGSGINGLYIRANPIKLAFGNVIVVDGNTLLGTATDSSNGKLQLATHTTSAGGIGFGTDVSLYRSGSNALSLNSGGSTNFFFLNNGSPIGYIVAGGTNFQLTASASLVLQTNNGTTALTLDTSQNATFAAKATVSSTTASTSTTTGALVVSGGVGVAGAVYAGSNLISSGGTGIGTIGVGTANAILHTVSNAPRVSLVRSLSTANARGFDFINQSDGVVNLRFVSDDGNSAATAISIVGSSSAVSYVSIPNTTASTSTTTGALVVGGGVGVAGALYTGGNVNATSATLTNSSTGTTAQAALNFGNGSYNGRLAVNGTAYTNDGVAGSNRTELQAPFSLNIISGQFKFFSNSAGAGEGTSGAANIFNIYGPSLGGRMEHLVQGQSASPYLASSTVGAFTSWNTATVTDNSTAASGTVASQVFHNFRQPALAATNSSVTTTDATTIYIAGGPTQGTNQTITNSYGLWNAGKTRLDNTVLVGTGTNSSNGIIQLATHTTSAGGIGFGTDWSFYRIDTNYFALSTTTGGATALKLQRGTTDYGWLYFDTVESFVEPRVSIPFSIRISGSTALKCDTSLNTTFSGIVIHKSYTVATLPAAAAGNTYGIVFVSDATNAAGTGSGTAPTGGGAVKRAVYSTGAAWLLL